VPERIETERLVLRRWTDADREPFAALNADPEVMEFKDGAGFIGFTGLNPVTFASPVQGEIEVGWRLARSAWGQGFASEAARAAVAYGFGTAGLAGIMSMTAAVNVRSRRVMERIGMRYDPASDFQHPKIPEGHPLRSHVVYRLAP
jgi:RimJ/RimL family protein N-acetyltransferase